MSGTCPACGCPETHPFLDLPRVPVHCNRLHGSLTGALSATRGDLRLHVCEHCAHIFNTAFVPEAVAYAPGYENSLHHSPRFDAYAQALAESLIARHGCRGARVVEIGCGRGDFLRLLCRLGDNRGLGFEPSHEPGASAARPGEPTIVAAPFDAAQGPIAAELVCCRHVLEHIAEPLPFLRTLRGALATDTAPVVFFEVPNAAYMLQQGSVWDLIYEHCGYFSAPSLRRVFQRAGFTVQRVWDSFEGQYLCIEAVPRPSAAGPDPRPAWDTDASAPQHLHEAAASFDALLRGRAAYWRTRLAAAAAAGERVALWGAGAKGVAFLNAVDGAAGIQAVVDINPDKLGRHVAGTGQRIVPPEALGALRPNLVILMNPAYRDEIRGMLDALGLAPDLELV